ncbi:MAG: AMP-binding protein, partial [Burkholderiaceae bacterium]|nr:AMP-binding protein [Burkholderiaceae bacterium]
MLLHEAFEATAARLPAKTALICGDERMSYAELQRRVQALAAQLQAAGVVPGDRVVLLLEGDVSYAVAVHAVLRVGAVFVPLMATTKADKLAFVINDTGAVALLADARLRATWAEMPARCPALRQLVTTDAFADAGERAPATIIDQDLAAIIYTSGSTGKPKGVMLTHLNMLSAWASVQAYLGLRED